MNLVHRRSTAGGQLAKPGSGEAGLSVIVPVILSGGSGTRLWPHSRSLFPKQFLEIDPPGSLFSQTVDRVADAALFAQPIIICNDEHRFIIAEQLRQSGVAAHDIVLEPVGRNTAPAATIACLIAAKNDAEAIVLVLPSDQVVRDHAAFAAAIRRGLPAAGQGFLVTFGVRPTRPETGYGYVHAGENLPGAPGCRQVLRFIEKPDSQLAAQLIAAGESFWNSGMFLFRARDFLEEMAALQPEILAACERALAGAKRDLDFLRLDKEDFAENPVLSIDHAVMEHSRRLAVLPVEFEWSDAGSWAALWEIGDKDAADNVTSGNVVLHETQGSYVHSNRQLVTTIGLSDIVVVATDDAVLVLPKNRSEDVRALVQRLHAEQHRQTETHTRVLRPWGYYQVIEAGERFLVKRIQVNPGCRLSTQMHRHRAEHWIVVAGVATITRGDETLILRENESAFVPSSTVHRLENAGPAPLQLIEVQSGSYLGEDDIVRYDDDYNRS